MDQPKLECKRIKGVALAVFDPTRARRSMLIPWVRRRPWKAAKPWAAGRGTTP